MSTIPHQPSLLTRYHRLQVLNQRIETELAALGAALRVAGLMPAGRPRIAPEFTSAQARAAHARFRSGADDEQTKAGERQYQRDRKRAARARGAA